jgi:hypothetical protein
MARNKMSEDLAEVEFDATAISGQAVTAITCTKLHSLVVNKAISGLQITIQDGKYSGGVAIAMPYAINERSFQLEYDCPVHSGVVVITSGNIWHCTVLTT